MRLARIRPRRAARPRPAAEPEADTILALEPEQPAPTPVAAPEPASPLAPHAAPTFALGFPHMTLLTVGAELYLIGDSNTDGSTRLLIVADANGDGLPDARLQWRVAGAWIDVTSLNTVPASSVVRSDGVTAQAAFDSLGTGGGGPVAATSVTTSAVAGQTTVEGALGAHQTAIAAKADAASTTSALAAKADAAATTTALAAKADAAGTTASLALKQDATPGADINANSHKVINLAAPASSTDAANKNYVDSVAQGQSPKDAVRAGTTANITLSGTQTIDTVAVIAGDRVLVKNQTTQANNGIYVAAAGAWARAVDMDTWLEVPGASTLITAGGQAGTLWVCNSVAGGTLNTTAITFVQASSASQVTSVLGRTGAVVATTGDYAVAQVTGAAPLASPTFTGTPAAPTAAGATNTTQIATTAYVQGEIAAKAPLASPTLTGTPAAPTASPGTSTTQIATTAFTAAAVAAGGGAGLTSATATSLQSGAPATTLGATEAQIGSQVTITPKSSSSKIRITARVDVTKDNSATSRVATARLRRGAAVTGVQVGQDCLVSSATALANFGPLVLNFVDSPGSTAAQTYTLSGLCGAAGVVTVARYELTAEELLAGGYDQTTPWAGTGGSTVSTQARLEDYGLDVRAFGADPTGSADSTTAFQNALATGKSIFVPQGTFKISSGDLVVNTSYQGIFGVDFNSVISLQNSHKLYFGTATGAPGTVQGTDKAGNKVDACYLRNINIQAGGNHSGEIVHLAFADNTTFRDVIIGLSSNDGSTSTDGVFFRWTQYTNFFNVQILVNRWCIHLYHENRNFMNEDHYKFYGCKFYLSKVNQAGQHPAAFCLERLAGRNNYPLEFLCSGTHMGVFFDGGGDQTTTRGILFKNEGGVGDKKFWQNACFHACLFEAFAIQYDTVTDATHEVSTTHFRDVCFLGGSATVTGFTSELYKNEVLLDACSFISWAGSSTLLVNQTAMFIGDNFLTGVTNITNGNYADISYQLYGPFSRTRGEHVNRPGTTSITTSATSQVINHGLIVTPQGVVATPSWSTTCYVDTIGSTSFTVHFGTAAPAGQTVAWQPIFVSS